MKIIFRTVKDERFFGNLISWWTTPFIGKFNGAWRNGFSHVELKFNNDICFSASSYENKVRAKVIKANEPSWKTYTLNVSDQEERIVLKWLESKEGAKYDYLGILGFVLDYVKDSQSKWFCSELCCEALRQFTDLIPTRTVSSEISPNKLHKLLGL